MNQRQAFRKVLQNDGIITIPECHDAIGAKIIEAAGFEAIGISGFGATASLFGKPDIGLTTMTEMVSIARGIASAVDIPVICDADTGYGNVNNVTRTVEEFEATGIAGIHMEDQITPKQCSLLEGGEIITLDEYLSKLKAALEARKDEDFVIIARTNAYSVLGIEEAIKRAQAFADAGADIVDVGSMKTKDEITQVKRALPDVPMYYTVQENSIYPFLTDQEAEDMGYKLISYPTSGTLQYAKVMMEMMNTLKKEGTTKKYENDMMEYHEFENLMGLERIKQDEERLLNL